MNADEGSPHHARSNTTLPPPGFKPEASVRSSPDRSLAQMARELGVSDNAVRRAGFLGRHTHREIDRGEREGLCPPRSQKSSP